MQKSAGNIHPTAIIPEDVILGEQCNIGPFVCIGSKCKIGKNVTIGANSVIDPEIHIGIGVSITPCCHVTGDVPDYSIVASAKGQVIGYAGAVKIPTHITSQSAVGSTGAKIIDIPTYSDLRGDLSVIEWGKVLSFSIARMFYTYNVPTTEVRGAHAHKKCHQFLVALNGSLNVLTDNGSVREEFTLESPNQGLLIPAGVWGTQYKHSEHCILLVLASEKYEASDYIRNYDEYLEYIKSK